MSVTPNELVTYGCLNMPEADSVTVGGAIDVKKRVAWYDLSANDTIDAVSSSNSDTGVVVQVAGRNAGGSIVTSATATLTGTTAVTNVGSLGTVERLLYAVASPGPNGSGTFPLASPAGSTAVGDLAIFRHTPVISAHAAQSGSANTSGTTPPLFKLQSGDGASVAAGQIIRMTSGSGINQLRMIIATSGYGTDVVAVNRDWGTIPASGDTYNILQGMLFEVSPNQVFAITRCFATAAADVPSGSTRTYYEKVFVVNNDTATDLTSAQIEVASESPALPGSAALDLALATSTNDTVTIANRQTAPAGVTFTTQPAFIYAVGSTLTHGAAPNTTNAQGCWLRLTLPAGTAAYKGSADVRTQGTTT